MTSLSATDGKTTGVLRAWQKRTGQTDLFFQSPPLAPGLAASAPSGRTACERCNEIVPARQVESEIYYKPFQPTRLPEPGRMAPATRLSQFSVGPSLYHTTSSRGKTDHVLLFPRPSERIIINIPHGRGVPIGSGLDGISLLFRPSCFCLLFLQFAPASSSVLFRVIQTGLLKGGRIGDGHPAHSRKPGFFNRTTPPSFFVSRCRRDLLDVFCLHHCRASPSKPKYARGKMFPNLS